MPEENNSGVSAIFGGYIAIFTAPINASTHQRINASTPTVHEYKYPSSSLRLLLFLFSFPHTFSTITHICSCDSTIYQYIYIHAILLLLLYLLQLPHYMTDVCTCFYKKNKLSNKVLHW
ncbi:hypothetical protein V1512DRAFT_258893 [Lipomyces arxii]|uniref:uncharacterized protein n=1 Tax=Lipomyces arxii TaxID=56418 RepID=UPI0034CE5E47